MFYKTSAKVILDQFESRSVHERMHVAVVDGQDHILQLRIIFKFSNLQSQINAFRQRDVAFVGFVYISIAESFHNGRRLRLRIRVASEHDGAQLITNERLCPFDRLFTLPKESWPVLLKNRLPDLQRRRVLLVLKKSLFELVDYALSWYATKLRIYRTQARLLSEYNFARRARDHCSRRHRDLWNNHANIPLEHSVKVCYQALRRRNITAWRMKDQVKAFRPIKLVNGHHEAVHVFIVYVQQLNSRLRQKTGIICNDVSFGELKETFKVAPPYDVRRRRSLDTFLLNFLENFSPVRQRYLSLRIQAILRTQNALIRSYARNIFQRRWLSQTESIVVGGGRVNQHLMDVD